MIDNWYGLLAFASVFAPMINKHFPGVIVQKHQLNISDLWLEVYK